PHWSTSSAESIMSCLAEASTDWISSSLQRTKTASCTGAATRIPARYRLMQVTRKISLPVTCTGKLPMARRLISGAQLVRVLGIAFGHNVHCPPRSGISYAANQCLFDVRTHPVPVDFVQPLVLIDQTRSLELGHVHSGNVGIDLLRLG